MMMKSALLLLCLTALGKCQRGGGGGNNNRRPNNDYGNDYPGNGGQGGNQDYPSTGNGQGNGGRQNNNCQTSSGNILSNELVSKCQDYRNNRNSNTRIIQIYQTGLYNCSYVCVDSEGNEFTIPKNNSERCGDNAFCYQGICYESTELTRRACLIYFNSNSDSDYSNSNSNSNNLQDVVAIRNMRNQCSVYCARNGRSTPERANMPLGTMCTDYNIDVGFCGSNGSCRRFEVNDENFINNNNRNGNNRNNGNGNGNGNSNGNGNGNGNGNNGRNRNNGTNGCNGRNCGGGGSGGNGDNFKK